MPIIQQGSATSPGMYAAVVPWSASTGDTTCGLACLILDDIYRAILILATLVSFVPQVYRIRSHGTSKGISPWYILIHAIVSTQNYALLVQIVLDQNTDWNSHGARWIGRPTVGAWLDVVQMGTVWICNLVLLFQLLYHPPSRPVLEASLLLLYAAWLSISLLAVLFELTPAFREGRDAYREWYPGLLFGFHVMYANPVITLSILVALYFQATKTALLPPLEEGSLSVLSLGSQAVVFILVGLSWIYRLWIPGMGPGRFSNPLVFFVFWYQGVGWAAVNELLVGIGKGIVFLVVIGGWVERQMEREAQLSAEARGRAVEASGGEEVRRPDEETPLLENHG